MQDPGTEVAMTPEMLRPCDIAGTRRPPPAHLAVQVTALVCSMSSTWMADRSC